MSKEKQSVSGTKTAARVLLAAVFVLLTAVCVFSCSVVADDGHSGSCGAIQPWNIENTLPTSGNYYLNTDVTLDETWRLTGDLTLCLNGHVVTMKNGVSGSVIRVPIGNTLNLYDCDTMTKHYFTVEDNGLWKLAEDQSIETDHFIIGGCITGGTGIADSYGSTRGGGVYIDGGTVIMNGGNIVGNIVTHKGGGVYVNGGKFTMSGNSSIVGNIVTTVSGGGVEISNGGEFMMMNNSSIRDNVAVSGGGVHIDSSVVTISDNASIVKNIALNGGSTVVSGGCGGGVSLGTNGMFNMINGSILDNIAENNGGGVYCMGDTFNMTGGTIQNNSSIGGSGVFIGIGGGVFNMSGGTIQKNIVTHPNSGSGGGVLVFGGTFNMSGDAKIIGNRAINSWSPDGVGLCVLNTGTFNVSESPIITDNPGKDNQGRDGADNVYLAGQAINITGNLSNADIRISYSNSDVFAQGSDSHPLVEDDAKWFHLDNSTTQIAKLVDGKLQWTIVPDGEKMVITEPTAHGHIIVDKTSAGIDTPIIITAISDTGYQLKASSLEGTYGASGKVTITEIDAGKYSFNMPAEDVTVTAVFESIPAQQYTITYNGNGNTSGTVPASPATYDRGTSVTVLGNIGNLVKDGFVFDGWNTKTDGTGTNHTAGSSLTVTADVILYAKWKQTGPEPIQEDFPVEEDEEGHGTSDIEEEITNQEAKTAGASVELAEVSGIPHGEATFVQVGETAVELPSGEEIKLILSAIDITPYNGTEKVSNFSAPVTITFKVTLPTGSLIQNLVVEHHNGTDWENITYTVLDYDPATREYTIGVNTDTFSPFVLGLLNDKTIYTITGKTEGSGALSLPSSAAEGETVAFSANAASGYTLKSISVNGDDSGEDIVYQSKSGVYSFTMPSENVTVKAIFRSSGGSGGSSSSQPEGTVWASPTPILTATAAPTATPTPVPPQEVPSVKPIGKSTQPGTSPIPFLGIFAGLGAAAVLFAARQRR